ncbi:MAG: hypothetical protein N2Z21_11250 [Candidatus Sumerlaeaceae bacterium]|nr:hypothetical protein [Candidatus Sumerlaeaceae bacterium]
MTQRSPSPQESLSELERRVLNLVQTDFPISHAPYEDMARQLGEGISPNDVHECVTGLVKRGIIRRLGGVFDTKKLGFMSALIAMRVPEERIDEVGEFISKYAGVSHNYKREHEYNLWFTLAAPSREQLFAVLEEMKTGTGISDVLYLPTVRMHKIMVRFELPVSNESAENHQAWDGRLITET